MTATHPRRPIPAWTDVLTLGALGAAAASAAGVLAGSLGGAAAPALWVVVLLVVGAGLLGGPWVGSVAGVAASWVALEVLRRTGGWGSTEFWAVGALIAALLGTGIAFGRLRVSAAATGSVPAAGTAPVVVDSVGVLTQEAGRLRLDEELARARATGRPLSVARISIRVLEGRADASAARAAERAVVRLVDSRLRVMDIPYAESGSDLVVVMPEAQETEALSLVADVLAAMRTTTYASRSTDERRTVAADVEVLVGIASWDRGMSGPDALLAAASPEVAA